LAFQMSLVQRINLLFVGSLCSIFKKNFNGIFVFSIGWDG
jgi:hypothetical protein